MRPVLLVAIGMLMGSTVLFIAATSVVWLFAAVAALALIVAFHAHRTHGRTHRAHRRLIYQPSH